MDKVNVQPNNLKIEIPNEDIPPSINEIELKIGIDIGVFLCELAMSFPEKYFFGVEIKPDRTQVAAHKVKKLKLTNVSIINAEGYECLSKHVKDKTLSTIHVYFPTPSPRSIGLLHPNMTVRLIRNEFVQEAYRALRPGGIFRFVTDKKDYFEDVCEYFDPMKWLAMDFEQLVLNKDKNLLVGTPTEIGLRADGVNDFYTLQLMRL